MMASKLPLRRRLKATGARSTTSLPMLLAILLIVILCYSLTRLPGRADGPVPAAILATGTADYSMENRRISRAPVDLAILASILEDADLQASNLPARLATLTAVLQTPVPTATRSFRFPLNPSPTATATGIPPTPTFTSTVTVTGTPTITHTATITRTSTSLPTRTRTPIPSPTKTKTITPTRTVTRTPTASSTLTLTSEPTLGTVTPPATLTDIPPPTLTQTLEPCNTIDPGATVLFSAADTHISSSVGQADSNFGGDMILAPRGGINPSNALIRFDLSSLPLNIRVTRAILYLYGQNSPTGANLDFYQVTGAWEEMTVTWNTAPAQAATPMNSLAVTGTANCLWAADLPPGLIQDWINGNIPNHGLLIKVTGSESEIRLSSREDPTSAHRPQLGIIYEGTAVNIGDYLFGLAALLGLVGITVLPLWTGLKT